MKVKDLMTPVEEYMTLGKDATLGEVRTALEGGKHRDILVVDANGDFAGVLTMTDIILALEPNYKRLAKRGKDTDILSNRFVSEIFKEFDLWTDSLADLCKKGCDIKVEEVMYVPRESEYIDEDAKLEHGVHHYIVGVHQPVIVRNKSQVSGILRMADIFEEIITRMNTCACNK